jgi:DNA ligase-1
VKRLATALDAARARRSRIGKEESIAGALRAIAEEGHDPELATAARIAAGRLLPIGDGRPLGVGGSLLLDVVRAATGFDDEVIIACARTAGDLAEAFALLVRRNEDADAREGVRLRAVVDLIAALASEPGRASKRAMLDAAFRRATPLETKYLAKALGGGLRIGAQEGVVHGAIARAFDVPAERVRDAAALVADVGDLAVLAHHGRLDDAHLVGGRPVAFMLATPIETVATPIDPSAFIVEDKIDGVRAQVHRTLDGETAIFARGLDRVTLAFPEIVDALQGAPGQPTRPVVGESVVLDGEIVAVAPSGRPRPFQALQARLKKSRPSDEDIRQIPVALVAFDILADPSGSLLHLAWRDRRLRLEAFVAAVGRAAIVLHPFTTLSSVGSLDAALDVAFAAARARGHEGLVLKRADAPYDAGRRGQAWMKVKRAHATLDVVIVAAEEGHGRRAGALSDYTFAVWREDDLVPVGKAYSGLTDVEIDAMTHRLEAITIERREGVRVVRPEIVLEVAFDGVQRSTRHASGFALRFPRIVRVRPDKTPEQADRIGALDAILAAQVASGHREPGPSHTTGRRRRTRGPQLSLFGDDES